MSLSAIGRTGDVTIRMIMNANGKATHTVTSHWYRSSRACGVGSGEGVNVQGGVPSLSSGQPY